MKSTYLLALICFTLVLGNAYSDNVITKVSSNLRSEVKSVLSSGMADNIKKNILLSNPLALAKNNNFKIPINQLVRGKRAPSIPKEIESAMKTNKTPQRLIRFVRVHKAEPCIQTVICQLSSNENFYGNSGVKFGQRLLEMESMTNENETKIYREARKLGRTISDPKQCKQHFPKCIYTGDDIVRIGIRMTNGLRKGVKN